MSLFSKLIEEREEKNTKSTLGIMTGIVKENWDDKYPGMIKVEFILSDTEKKVTDWIRVMTPYGGNNFGTYFFPEIDTEVIVAFIMGDIDNPVVLGCVWNNKDSLPEETADDKNTIKSIQTKAGSSIKFSDKENEEMIELQTVGKLKVSLMDKEGQILLEDENAENTILLDAKNGSITLKAAKTISLEAGSETFVLNGQGQKTEMNSNNLTIEGKQAVNLKTSSSLKAEGTMIELKAQSNLKAEASAILELKGAMAKIN